MTRKRRFETEKAEWKIRYIPTASRWGQAETVHWFDEEWSACGIERDHDVAEDRDITFDKHGKVTTKVCGRCERTANKHGVERPSDPEMPARIARMREERARCGERDRRMRNVARAVAEVAKVESVRAEMRADRKAFVTAMRAAGFTKEGA